jgi:hypothetical protein
MERIEEKESEERFNCAGPAHVEDLNCPEDQIERHISLTFVCRICSAAC